VLGKQANCDDTVLIKAATHHFNQRR
jgi:hypothetical protein